MKAKHIFSNLLVLVCITLQLNAQTTDWKPIVVGKTCTIYSKQLAGNRSLNIYLPEGYTDTGRERYPVIYVPDGAMDEDFLHLAGLVQFSSMAWVKRLPPSILVGIVNTDRRRDFTYPTTIAGDKKLLPNNGGSEAYIRFLGQELQPFINKSFRTNGQNTIIGQSLGGLLAAEILLKQPAMYSKYIIISPSLWWNDGSMLQQNTNVLTALKDSISVFIAVGKEGLTPTERPHVMEVDANLLTDKLRQLKLPKLDLYFDYLPNEDHATIGHQAVVNAFNYFADGGKAH